MHNEGYHISRCWSNISTVIKSINITYGSEANSFRSIVSTWKDNIKLGIRNAAFQGLFICSWLTVLAFCSGNVNKALTARGRDLPALTLRQGSTLGSEIYINVSYSWQYSRTRYQVNTVYSVVTAALSDTPSCKTIQQSRTGSLEITEELHSDFKYLKTGHTQTAAQIF